MDSGFIAELRLYLDILGRSVLAIVLLLLVARLLGKQTISSMTIHDFVTAITLGSMAANLAFNENIKSWNLIISLFVFTSASLILSRIALKSRKWRKWISGAPTILIENGKILEDNMKKIRYTLDSLNEMLREKEIFDIEEVEYAMIEINGRVSVMKKKEHRPVTRRDLQMLSANASEFPVELIMDGELIYGNFDKHGVTVGWLNEEIEKRSKKLSDVFYAVRGSKGQLYLDYYEDHVRQPIDAETRKGSPV